MGILPYFQRKNVKIFEDLEYQLNLNLFKACGSVRIVEQHVILLYISIELADVPLEPSRDTGGNGRQTLHNTF